MCRDDASNSMNAPRNDSTNLDEIVEPVDLGQPPGDIAVLSFADSDLAGLAAAWAAERSALPSVRLAHLRDLRHPMSVDLWIDRVGAHAKVILVRLLGGLDWWKYGIERLSALARERGIVLAVLPGEDRDDARLAAASTLPPEELDRLLRYFREGGRENLRALLRRLARHAELCAAEPGANCKSELNSDRNRCRVRRLFAGRGRGRSRSACRCARIRAARSCRSSSTARCCSPPTPRRSMRSALRLPARGLAPAPLVVTSLKDTRRGRIRARRALARLDPPSSSPRPRSRPAQCRRADARSTARTCRCCRLSARRPNAPHGATARADLALPISRCTSFCPSLTAACSPASSLSRTRCRARGSGFHGAREPPGAGPDRDGCGPDARAGVRCERMPRAERRVAVLMPDYPSAPGRTGYAVGLDVPASVTALIDDLAAAGYAFQRTRRLPCTARRAFRRPG